MSPIAPILTSLFTGATALAGMAPQTADPKVADEVRAIQDQVARLSAQVGDLAQRVAGTHTPGQSRLSIEQGYIWVLLVAFLVSLCATPLMRQLAIKNGIVDEKSEAADAGKKNGG